MTTPVTDTLIPADPAAAGTAKTKARKAKAVAASGDKTDRAFRTIGEVAETLGLAQHVLRFWEKKFYQIKPVKRSSGRRYYRVEDIELLREIRTLLHDQGYTIRGVQKLLREGGLARAVKARANGTAPAAPEAPAKAPAAASQKKLHSDDLRQVAMPFDLLKDMSGMRQTIRAALTDLEALHAELAARQRR